MKKDDLSKKTKTDLKELLKTDHEKLRLFRFDLTAGKVKNIRGIRKLKKDIARILTFLNK